MIRAGRGNHHRRALTLVELIFAIAGTAAVGLAVAGMLAATSYGTSSRNDMRELLVRGKAVNERVAESVRSARRVLAHGDDWLVLWLATEDHPETPTLHSLLRIEFDSTAEELIAYRASEGAAEASYELDENFAALTQQLINQGTLTPRRWSRAVANWRLFADEAPPATRYVRWELELVTELAEHATVAAASPRRAE